MRDQNHPPPPSRRSRRRGASLVEVLVVLAVFVLGLIVAMRAFSGQVNGSAGRVGDAVITMGGLEAQPGGDVVPVAFSAEDARPDAWQVVPAALQETPGPTPAPSPGPAPTPPSTADENTDSSWWDDFTGLWENGLWDEEKCRDLWSLDCAREYALKGALSNVWNSLKAVWDTGAEVVTGTWDLLQQWWDDPTTIVTQPIENAKACFGDLLSCGGDVLGGALELVWDDTSTQLWNDRDFSGLIGRTGAKIGLVVAGPSLVKAGLRLVRGIFGRGDHDGGETPDNEGGGGSGGSGGSGANGGSGAQGGAAGSGDESGAGGEPAAGGGASGQPAAGSGSPSATPLPRGNPDPNARARGNPETDPRATRQKQEDLQAQNEDADNLARAGYDIEHNDTPLRNEHGREPDYIIDGRFADHAHVRSSNPEQARKAISAKVPTQATRIVVRIHPDSSLSIEDIQAILRRKPIAGLEEVIFVENGVVTSFIP